MLLSQQVSFDNISLINECTPLYIASQNGHLEVVKILLQHKAFADLANIDGCTPLDIAVQKRHLEVVKILLDNNAYVNDRKLVLGLPNEEGFAENSVPKCPPKLTAKLIKLRIGFPNQINYKIKKN
jgi:ankyrin repeat protein